MIPTDKKILWSGQPSHWIKAHYYLVLSTAAAAFFIGAYALPRHYSGPDVPDLILNAVQFAPPVLLGSGVFCLIAIWWIWLNLRYTQYVLTEDTLYTRHNWLSGDHDTLWVYLIRDVRAELPLHLRLIGLGRVVLYTKDKSHPSLPLEGLRGARDVKALLNRMAREQGHEYGVRVLDTGA